jgi:hypothetical protein
MNAAVHDYMGRGWSIIPIRPGDKRPLARWEEFQHRHPTETEVGVWFYRCPEAGIGIVTGAISGLVVIDVDVGHGGDESVERLEREHGHLPGTVECRTGGGGRHLYFAHPGGLVRNKIGLARSVRILGRG